jgi:GntR family transcriptional regulator/MocR family aminotransferase
MPRRPVSVPLTLAPAPGDEPAYRWLYGAIRAEILDGLIEPGHRLPATRDLARQYGLSRGTVVAAFDLLQAEGYVESAVGSGTRVSRVVPEPRRVRRMETQAALAARPRRLAAAVRRITIFRQHDAASACAFRANQPALDLFPRVEWARVASRRWRRGSTDLLAGTEPLGYPPLRAAIAAYLRVSRGVICEPGRVAVVSGMQEALALTATLLVDPGDVVCVENPGYGGASRVMAAAGARVRDVPVDGEGACVPAARVAARLAYLTPAHQFPLGMCMTMARRQAWLAWARASGAALFEDDYDSEYRYSGRPVAALQGLDREGTVIFAGSFSKVLCPALRLGYVVLPGDLVDPAAAALSVTSRHASVMTQVALEAFMTEGHFARHLRRMRDVYAERRGALIEAAARWLGGRLDVVAVEAGLQTVGYVADGIDGTAVAAAAAAQGVEVLPLRRHTRGRLDRDGLQLGFAAVPPGEIARGAQVLARVIGASVRR